MTRPDGTDMANDGHSKESQIANDVEYLVTDKFVGKSERLAIEHSIRRQSNSIVE